MTSKVRIPLSQTTTCWTLTLRIGATTGGDTDRDLIPALLWHIARVMIEIEETRTRYKHGTAEARIYRNIVVPETPAEMRKWDVLFGILLFGAHTAYRRRLRRTYIKEVVYLPEFRRLMESLLLEWADTNLLVSFEP